MIATWAVALALQWVAIFWQWARIRQLGKQLSKLRIELIGATLKAHYSKPEVIENMMFTYGPLMQEQLK